MGFPPPPSGPEPGVSASPGSFDAGTTTKTIALPCGINISIPIPNISFTLPSLALILPALPSIGFSLKLSCDLSNPIDITGGISFGGGRKSNAPPDPDNDDSN